MKCYNVWEPYNPNPMNDIQDEAYTEACKEIERINKDIIESAIRRKLDVDMKRLKALCARAANLLDGYDEYRNFILELREASK